MGEVVILIDILIEGHLGGPMVTLGMKITLDKTSMLLKINIVRDCLLVLDMSLGDNVKEKRVKVGQKTTYVVQINMLMTNMIDRTA